MLMRLVGSVVELGLWVVVFLVVLLFIFFGLRGYNCYLSTTNSRCYMRGCGHPVLVTPHEVGATGLSVILSVLLAPLFTEYKFVNCILFRFG